MDRISFGMLSPFKRKKKQERNHQEQGAVQSERLNNSFLTRERPILGLPTKNSSTSALHSGQSTVSSIQQSSQSERLVPTQLVLPQLSKNKPPKSSSPISKEYLSEVEKMPYPPTHKLGEKPYSPMFEEFKVNINKADTDSEKIEVFQKFGKAVEEKRNEANQLINDARARSELEKYESATKKLLKQWGTEMSQAMNMLRAKGGDKVLLEAIDAVNH